MRRVAPLFLLLLGCDAKPAGPARIPDAPVSTGSRDYEAAARALYAGEKDYEAKWPVEFHIRIVEGITQDLNRAIIDLGGSIGPDLFADRVDVRWAAPDHEEPVIAGVTVAHWKDGEAKELGVAETRALWTAYLDEWQFVEHALVKVKANPKIPGLGFFEGTASIEVVGKEKGKGWRRDAGKVHLGFTRTARGWRITKMHFDHLASERRAEKIFADVTGEWLAGVDAATREKLTRGSVSDDIHARLVSGEPLPGDVTLQPVAMDAHPGVAVVDVDVDGWDDLFVWDVLGAATLLRNKEGKGFEEASARFGLDLRDVSAAAFADLDNDGVTDVVVGRWWGRSEILRGARSESGVTFLPSDTARRLVLPTEVASLAIADVNRDGLLDVYFGTAANDYHARQIAAGRAPSDADAHVGQLGPKDVLLLNKGARGWEDGTVAAGLTQERNTLAPSFADVNGDDWPDLYVGNDFARGLLFLNEAGKFKDVSKEAGADEVIYGMGASWGDFDADGDLDLYASAMQSSAGARIMSDEGNFASNLGAGDRTARKLAARGNTLLRNDGGGKFSDATKNDAFKVARGANWAYGSIFVDVDNDGWLDVFAPNGFFTAKGQSPDGLTRDL